MYQRTSLGDGLLPGGELVVLSDGTQVQIAPGPPVRVVFPVPIGSLTNALVNEAGILATQRFGGSSWQNVWSDTVATVLPVGWWVNWDTREQVPGRESDGAPTTTAGWRWQRERQDFAADDAAVAALTPVPTVTPAPSVTTAPPVVDVAAPALTSPDDGPPPSVKTGGLGGKAGLLVAAALVLAMFKGRK